MSYGVPEKLLERVRVGSIVRVPLRNRRVRGWVIKLNAERRSDVLEISSVSGVGPVFDEPLLAVAGHLARDLVQPLSAFLSLHTPPRLGRPAKPPSVVARPAGDTERSLRRWGPAEDPLSTYIPLIEERLDKMQGVIVSVPEIVEGSRILDALAKRFPGEAAVVHSGVDPALRSSALWQVARREKRLVLGGRAALFVPPLPAGLIIIHQEHDPSFKDRRAPYYDARDVALLRAASTGSDVLFASRTPSLWSMFRDDLGIQEPSREEERAAWPVVELVRQDGGRMPRRTIAAIIGAYRAGARSLVLIPRVTSTDSGPGPAELVEFIRRVVPGAEVARADRPSLGERQGALKQALNADVIIGSEAALAEVERPPISTAIALSVDSYMKKAQGRAMEDTFAMLWNLGALVAGQAPRGRLFIETSRQDHYALRALQTGDYRHFVQNELDSRRQSESPPLVRLAKLRITHGEADEALLRRLRSLPGTRVLGPVPGNHGPEILLKIDDMKDVVEALSGIMGEATQRILVEVDPRDW